MAKVLDSFATVLDMTTRAFLLDEQKPNFEKLRRAVEEHQASFTSLKRNLSEAKSEWTDYRVRAAARDLQGSEHELYDAAVEGMTRIAQHLNGLRDGTRLQNELSELANDPSSNGKTAVGNGVANGKSPMTDPQPSFALVEELLEDVGPPLESLSVRHVDADLRSGLTNCHTESLHLEPQIYARCFPHISATTGRFLH